MKKLFALLLAAMLLVTSVAALAEAPEGYPEVVDGIDFGGDTVYIWLYWAPNARSADPTEEQQARYDYQDWIMETYNVKIVEEQKTDWSTCAQEMIDFATVNNGEKAIFVV